MSLKSIYIGREWNTKGVERLGQNIFILVTKLVTFKVTKMLRGLGRIIFQNNERPKKVLIYIPQDIVKDSQFPFKESQGVNIIVDAKKKEIRVQG